MYKLHKETGFAQLASKKKLTKCHIFVVTGKQYIYRSDEITAVILQWQCMYMWATGSGIQGKSV